MVKLHSAHQQLGSFKTARETMLQTMLKTALKLRGSNLSSNEQSSPEAGLTLLECLVAMIIITVIVAIITPPIFLAVGTRVNNQRTEQALQVAQDEIERVRLLMTSGQPYDAIEDRLPPVAAGVTRTTLSNAAVPSGVCDTETKAGPPPLCSDAAQLFLAFGGSKDDPSALYVQTFRDEGVGVTRTLDDGSTRDEVIAFNMGVRVYSHEAVNDAATGVGNIDSSGQAASINFTSGTKQRGARPLVVMYTEMTRGTERDALVKIRDEYTNNP